MHSGYFGFGKAKRDTQTWVHAANASFRVEIQEENVLIFVLLSTCCAARFSATADRLEAVDGLECVARASRGRRPSSKWLFRLTAAARGVCRGRPEEVFFLSSTAFPALAIGTKSTTIFSSIQHWREIKEAFTKGPVFRLSQRMSWSGAATLSGQPPDKEDT